MEIKVKQMVALDEDSFDEVLVQYLRNIIDRAEDEDCKYGPDPYIIEAMKVTHDWFSMPSDWYNTVAQMEEAQEEFRKHLAEIEKEQAAKKPAKMKAKKTK